MNAETLAALLDTGSRLATLKRLPRTGWLQRGVVDPESVADHSFGVAILALLIGPALDVDQTRLLRMALLHDYAEALMTDLPLSAKRLIGAEAKHAGERRAMQELLADLPDGEAALALWDEYNAARSKEARLLKALDRIEMLMQALEYERAGNRLMGEFWDGNDEGWPDEFPQLRELAQMLAARRP